MWGNENYFTPTVEVALDDRDQLQQARLFLCFAGPYTGVGIRRGMKAESISLLRTRCVGKGDFLALETSKDLDWVRRIKPERRGAPPPYSPDDINNEEGRKYIICELKGDSTRQFREALALLLRDPHLERIHSEIGDEEVRATNRRAPSRAVGAHARARTRRQETRATHTRR